MCITAEQRAPQLRRAGVVNGNFRKSLNTKPKELNVQPWVKV
jgi:hypothetical protein